MSVIIVGGGIGGLSLALALFKAGVPCHVYEAAADIKPLGVGLNLLPHAVTELGKLGLLDQLLSLGVETRDVSLFTAHGQLVHREERGRHAGYQAPQISMHRGDLHMTLLQAVIDRLGEEAVHLGHRCVSADQDATSATAHFVTPDNRTVSARGSAVIGCDGIHSVIRKQMHPNEAGYRFHGTVQYRGVTVSQPFLTGRSMAYVGTPDTGKLVVYPIRENVDAQGRQLINWVVEVTREDCGVRDWNRRASYEDFIGLMAGWTFDWLDIPSMIRNASSIYEYPVVDQDPLPAWTDRRITLLGDAAHPMLPRGSNGAAQAIIDGNTLAQLLAGGADPVQALKTYEEKRLPATARIVLTNREQAPDAILGVVERRTNGQPFAKLDDVISQEEIARWQESYKAIAGFSIAQLPK